MILDWWLSPELQVGCSVHVKRPPTDLQLRRPAALFPEWRLDRLLKRKAEQGVRIYVMVYKEVAASMALSSKHTKHALEELHENIACMRHPDHSGGTSALLRSMPIVSDPRGTGLLLQSP
jgi:phospholipase D1/2